MQLSLSGAKMAGVSGLRSIMEDVAASTANGSARTWLNLSVGNPAAIAEATAMWRGLLEQSLAGDFDRAGCRYGPSRGSDMLIGAVRDYFNAAYGWQLTSENIVVGPGSQMLCFVAAALFAGPGEQGDRPVVLPMVPDYTGYQGLCMNEGGIVGIPPRVVREDGHRFHYAVDLQALRGCPNPGMLLISSPGNPTGRAVTREELDALVEWADERDVPLLVDHAYGAPFPQIAQVHTEPLLHPRVINCFSMSKAGMPGERVGFAIGAPQYIDAMAAFLSNSVLHAPQLSQAALARGLRGGQLDRITRTVIKPYYQAKRRFAEKLLAEIMPDDVDWRLHSGDGGMFCWLWVDHEWFDDLILYTRLKAKGVFVVPGRHFFVDPLASPSTADHGRRCFRISLSAEEPVLAEGLRLIAETWTQMRALLP